MDSPAAIIGLTQFLNKEKIPHLDVEAQRAMEASFIGIMSSMKIRVADPNSVINNTMGEIYSKIKDIPMTVTENIADPVSIINKDNVSKPKFVEPTISTNNFNSTPDFTPTGVSEFSMPGDRLNIPDLGDTSPNFLDSVNSTSRGGVDVTKLGGYDESSAIPVDELLADIDNYIAELDMNGIAHDRVPKPERGSSYNQILTIRNILKNKSERIVAGTIGESVLLGGANLLGSVFDGERNFGPFKPNLVGCDATLATKLHRNRSQIATVTQKGLEQIGLSGSASILVDLLFSAITYSSRNSKSSGYDQVSQANYNLR